MQFNIGFLNIGNFLMMCTIVAKLWRIYYIFRQVCYIAIANTILLHFRNPDSVNKSAITDSKLLSFILLLVALQGIMLFIYVVVETGYPGFELEKTSNLDHPTELVGVHVSYNYS